MTYVIALDDPRATNAAVAGGKGANLARLVAAGFTVPGGAVIAADAYRAFADGAPTHDAAAARDALAAAPMPADVERELRDWLARDGRAAYAVRSSGTMEDGAAAAFAGQHDTFLNCVGADEVVARVRDCWCSLWQERAVAYRASRRDGGDAAMAVVVQAMLRCDTAGVAFTMDPITGALDHVVVDANAGLGESVVAGAAAVDHFVVGKATGRVVERRVVSKTTRVVPAAQGVVEEAVAGADAARPSLGDELLAELARLAVRVERLFGWPQDVEWGVVSGRVHLLQSRPVTTAPARWTRDESAERFPNVVTPLTWDFVEAGFHRSLAHSLALMGESAFGGKWFTLVDGYVYGNQTAVELYARRAPAGVGTVAELCAALPALREQFAWVARLPGEWHAALPRFLADVDAFLAEPVETYDERALWDHVERVNEAGARYFLPNIAISLGHGVLHRAVHALAAAAAPDDAERLMAVLLAGETQTTRVNAALARLAERARADSALAAALRDRESRALLAARPGDTTFWIDFDALVAEHGHRETDFDAYHPTWADAPWVPLDCVRAMLDAEARPAVPAGDADAALARLLGALPEAVRDFARDVVRLAREYTALDDLEHYHTTRLSRPLRRAVRTLGERLVARGVVREPGDAFFARRATVAAAVARLDALSLGALAAEAAAGRAAWEAARRATPPWRLGGATEAPAAAGARTMAGTPGSPGVAEGPAFVVHDADDFARFPRGAVLVARTTNPAWTPLFHAAAAVVTESGGALSHGAVTAREMGIPAVMSARGATAIVDGTLLRVDGTAGRVTLLAGAPAPEALAAT